MSRYPRGVPDASLSSPRDAGHRLIVIAGATGTGKSALAVALAQRLDGEIINADSMQLYRGMDIGTAKLSPAQRHGVAHHLLDVLDVTDTASVAAYQRSARAAIDEIRARGRTPMLVGGSGLYIQAVIDEMKFPGTDPAVRSRLTDELAQVGAAELFARLQRRDPTAAEQIQPANGRRIVRALEVIEITGQPFTASLPTPGEPRYGAMLLCLDRETEVLDAHLARRVDAMMAAGFLDEVRALESRGLRNGTTASRALGYRQLLEALDGSVTVDDAVTATVTATRRFVRKQRSWFRRDARMTWLDSDAPTLVDRALRCIEHRSVR